MARCAPGGIIRSSVVTMYQLGLVRHAGSAQRAREEAGRVGLHPTRSGTELANRLNNSG